MLWHLNVHGALNRPREKKQAEHSNDSRPSGYRYYA